MTGRRDAGFSLVSVLVAMVLVSVGIISISNVLTQSVAMQTISSQRSNALSIAQSEMERIRSLDPTAVAAVAAVTVDEDGSLDANGVFTREVTVTAVPSSVGPDLIEVAVIVTTPRSSPTRLVTWIYHGAT